MAVISLTGYRTQPGRFNDHLEASIEALGHLHRLGQQAALLQAIAGGDVGTMTMSVNYADMAGYAAGLQAVQADPGWQEFWGRVSTSAPAMQEEGTLWSDLDPSFAPDPDRPLGAVMYTQWRAKDGKLIDFLGKVNESLPMVERMGGQPRPMQSLIGAYPMTVGVAITFADLDALGAYADTSNTDPEWQAFWAAAMSDPTADMIRSGIYLNIGA